MRAGILRHPVIVGIPIVTNVAGQRVERWEVLARTWASIQPANSNDSEWGKGLRPETTHKITIRHLPNLTSDHRIVFQQRVFSLTGPPLNDAERDREMILSVKEISGEVPNWHYVIQSTGGVTMGGGHA